MFKSDKAKKTSEAPKKEIESASPFARWSFMLAMFVYLFALALTLFEVDAFQSLVSRAARPADSLVTDAFRQRQILQAVRVDDTRLAGSDRPGMKGDGDKPNAASQSAEQLLVANVAQHFDALRGAVSILNDLQDQLSFATLEQRSGPVFENAQEQRAKELLKRIADVSEGLNRRVAGDAARDPMRMRDSIAWRTDLKGLNEDAARLAEELNALTGQAGAAAGEERRKTLADAFAAVKEGTAQLDARANKAKTDLDELLSKIKAAKPAELEPAVLSSWATQLQTLVAKLRASEVDKVADLIAASGDWGKPTGSASKSSSSDKVKIEKVPAKEIRRAELPDSVIDALRAYGKVKDTSWRNDALADDAKLNEILRDVQGKQKIPVDGGYGPTTAGELNVFIEECTDPACFIDAGDQSDPKSEEQGKESTTRELDRMANALDVLGRTIENADGEEIREPGSQQRRLLRALAEMELAAFRLGNLQIETAAADPSDSQKVDVERARQAYERALSKINGAVDDIRESFGPDSRLNAVAQAIGEENHEDTFEKAETIIREYHALGRYQPVLTPLVFLRIDSFSCSPIDAAGFVGRSLDAGCQVGVFLRPIWNHFSGIGFRAKGIATMTREALNVLVVCVMGAVGSLIYLVRYLLGKTLQGVQPTSPLWRPLSWYVFRPVFGVVVAFAIFLLYKTGQIALGGAQGNVSPAEVNLPILSIFSLFAGLLSWQALELVESKGRTWLADQHRGNLWAVGLEAALATAGKTRAELAAQVGVSSTQVDRWINFQDKVTPEMQDRILTWLNRKRVELFSRDEPAEDYKQSLAWGVGLKDALATHAAVGDVPQLAQLITRDVDTVAAWVNLDRQVPADAQFSICEVLGVEWNLLFSRERPGDPYWAVGLRKAMSADDANHRTAESLARAVGSTQSSIRAYMELRNDVSKILRERIAKALEIDEKALFSAQRPLDNRFQWAPGLRRCMRGTTQPFTSATLADAIDTEQEFVRAWMEQAVCGESDAPYCGQVAPDTQQTLADALKCEQGTLFRSDRAQGDFRWALLPALRDAIGNDIGGWADRLDVPPNQIDRWLAREEQIAPGTQHAILEGLGASIESLGDYFTHEPPLQKDADEGVLWATGLRQAVKEHAGLASLSALAERLQVSSAVIYDLADLLQPVERGQRERIRNVLGPSSASGTPVFTKERPAWNESRWAPGLRAALRKARLNANVLARALDADLEQVRAWMEQNEAERASVAPTPLRLGQVPPALNVLILATINAEVSGGAKFGAEIFSEVRDDIGSLYARRPSMRLAIEAQSGGISEFAEQLDAGQEQIERWTTQQEKVLRATQDDALSVLGLTDAERSQLFTESPGIDPVIG